MVDALYYVAVFATGAVYGAKHQVITLYLYEKYKVAFEKFRTRFPKKTA